MKFSDSGKYKPYKPVDIADRTWPSKQIEKAPIWCSVDLRDGNQALIKPMDIDQKLTLYKLLLKLNFKHIEIGFPSASQIEYDFLRTLVEKDLIPDDVTIQVLVQAREHLIKRTFEALRGVKRAIVHLYNSTSVAQRKIVFNMQQEQIIALALDGVDLIKKYEKMHDGEIVLEYSPESFTGTELDFAARICNAVTQQWGVAKGREVIINLPATVEMSTPNIYADQVEWMGRHLENREHILISTHTHNDRGTSVAATELALLAGADRVEGTLLSNGERTGNVDIITLALNMYSQGVDAKLDFSNVNEVVQVVETCTDIATHVRHPYVGELVYTAFSGSHQDAINKGMHFQASKDDALWEVPYLPIDPSDVGRSYESIIRINSQSGKGGVAYILEDKFGYILPKKMHPEVGAIVQKETERLARELSNEEILAIFEKHYLCTKGAFEFLDVSIESETTKDNSVEVEVTFNVHSKKEQCKGVGNGPIDACKNALQAFMKDDFTIVSYSEHSCGEKSSAKAIAYIQIEFERYKTLFGVGTDTDITVASIKALFNAINLAGLK